MADIVEHPRTGPDFVPGIQTPERQARFEVPQAHSQEAKQEKDEKAEKAKEQLNATANPTPAAAASLDATRKQAASPEEFRANLEKVLNEGKDFDPADFTDRVNEQ